MKPRDVAGFLDSEPKRYSQFREEVCIRHFFNDEANGFFVECGAGHAWDDSTTAYLDAVLGWSGLSIDARAEVAVEFEQRLRSRFFSYVVTDYCGAATFYRLAERPSISSAVEGYVESSGVAGVPVAMELPATTLDALLERERVERIDFLSMDIEGAEMRALSCFDMERWKPRLVCVEIGTEQKGRELLAYFAAHGYRRIDEYLPHDGINFHFTPM